MERENEVYDQLDDKQFIDNAPDIQRIRIYDKFELFYYILRIGDL